jgi:hypothetical protein
MSSSSNMSSKVRASTKVSLPPSSPQPHAVPTPRSHTLQQLGQTSPPDEPGSHLPTAARGVLDKFPAQAAEIRRVASTK